MTRKAEHRKGEQQRTRNWINIGEKKKKINKTRGMHACVWLLCVHAYDVLIQFGFDFTGNDYFPLLPMRPPSLSHSLIHI